MKHALNERILSPLRGKIPFQKGNIVRKLFRRQIGSLLAHSFENSCFPEIFQHLSLRQELIIHTDSDEKHKLLAPSLRRASRIVEITASSDIIVVLEERGLCAAFEIGG